MRDTQMLGLHFPSGQSGPAKILSTKFRWTDFVTDHVAGVINDNC
ncbi:MAG: hypothetical protein QNJ20_16785 [Paracoccaceae bacterium]|nr:hypothetical protein [Paracoccaceae bacterium]